MSIGSFLVALRQLLVDQNSLKILGIHKRVIENQNPSVEFLDLKKYTRYMFFLRNMVKFCYGTIILVNNSTDFQCETL